MIGLHMKRIDWKARLRNKAFWLAMIPALFLLLQRIGTLLGVEINFELVGQQIKGIAEAAFSLLIILGIVVDPSTEGVTDSPSLDDKHTKR